jgi:hypothetical protein
MALWDEAMDDLVPLEEGGDLTIDQRLKAIEVRALLSISQELSMIRVHGISPNTGDTAPPAPRSGDR